MATQTTDRINVDKLMQVLSEILSEKYGCKITMKAIPKEEYREAAQEEQQPKAG